MKSFTIFCGDIYISRPSGNFMADNNDPTQGKTINDLHLWMFSNGYESVWFAFEEDCRNEQEESE
jgi:hypothetical protein